MGCLAADFRRQNTSTFPLLLMDPNLELALVDRHGAEARTMSDPHEQQMLANASGMHPNTATGSMSIATISSGFEKGDVSTCCYS